MTTKASFRNEYRHSWTYPVITFRKIRSKSNFPQVGLQYTYSQSHTQGSPTEIQTSALWNLIGRSMTVSSSVLSPNGNLPSPSYHYTFIPARKNSVHVSQTLFRFFTFFFKKLRNFKLYKPGRVGTFLKSVKSCFDLRTKTKKLGHRNVVIQHLSTFWTGSICVRTDKKEPASEKLLYILSIYRDTDSVSDIRVSPLDTKVPLEGRTTIGTIRRSAKLRRL